MASSTHWCMQTPSFDVKERRVQHKCMFVKAQHLDTSCFGILGSSKGKPPLIISADRVEPTKKHREKRVLESPTRRRPRYFPARIYKRTHENSRVRVLVHKPGLFPEDLVSQPSCVNHGKCSEGIDACQNRYTVGNLNPGHRNGSIKKMPTNCSAKGLSYGGCIPAILEALGSVSDLDEALRPWEESLSNKERTIILKEQTSWERAMEVFEWFKRKGCYEVNVIHYNIMLRIFGKARKWSQVESLWAEMMKKGIEPINSTYGTLIDVYAKGGRKDEALNWVELMHRQGMRADEVTMGTVVQAYKKSGEFQKAEEFFMKWSSSIASKDETKCSAEARANPSESTSEEQVCLSLYTFNTLIDTFGKAGQLKEASETFARMLREGIAPNTITFNTMIHICGNHGQMAEVSSLIRRMEELHCPPDTRTYNILISLYAKHDDIKMAASYFSKIKEAQLEPDPVSYRTLLYAFSRRRMVAEAEDLVSEMDERGLEIDEYTQSAMTRMYIDARMVNISWMWFERFHAEGNMSSECYAANIDAYGERGHILEAEKAFTCCQGAGKLTVLEFNVMIKAYGLCRKYDKACQLFDSIHDHGVTPDKCSFNSLIQILASGDLPHLAKLYMAKMQEAGLVTDCVPYCAIISSFAKLSQLKMAEEMYEEMVKFGVQPDLVVYGVLINAFADEGSVKEALHYVDAMKNAGLVINAVICNSLIKLYTKVGYLKEAQETYEILHLSEEGPDVYSSNCMIDLYSERTMVKEAEDIFNSLRKKRLANEFSFAMMLCMYKRLGWFKQAIQIVQEMRDLGLLTDLLSYNNVLAVYVSDSRFKEAVETFKEMLNAPIQPDDCTFKLLGLALLRRGVSKEAISNLEAKREKDVQYGLQEWMSVLSSLVVIGYDDNNQS